MTPRPAVSGVLVAGVEAQLARLNGRPAVVSQVFGAFDPRLIAAALDRFCREHLGACAVESSFLAASVGSVHGLVLDDGRRVVVKGHRPATGIAYLVAVQEAQRRFAERGVPAPRPLTPPSPLGSGVGTAEALLDGGWADPHDPATRAEIAGQLTRFAAAGRRLVGSLPQLPAMRAASVALELWPEPHDARFDFRASEDDARWIDDLARRARLALEEHGGEDEVVGHADWRVQNLAFDAAGRLCAVYDWDSLRVLPEAALAGRAAASFSCDWSRTQRQYPTLEEALGFLGDFEAARDRPFAAREWRLARASLVDALAYNSRCEHSDQATGFGTHASVPVAAGDFPKDSARALLAAHGASLLAYDEGRSG